ncbi:TLC domain-containing protein 5-like [Dreissena polymorpha]|uniref:TLC domain-containing protein n=1 Tax=Dreissena polymorpha TaxID=45954 RepID=A0A9D3YI52_DREPO|nr:TLC domain-containing protein 5-like [Dreissena polymorpha]XP_052253425.1 TLC domain-containing protein 5-like [Dreissena polymorpha]XP_052253426.1 TLC domain-containing protein 5-like [Dreissena polymorpha]KAH3699234.1 hypothetical protein DPMN_074190 [Dreissena polymorpha]
MDDIATLLISVFTWSTLYFTLCLLNPRRSYEWHIRTVTVVHAVTVTILGLYSIFVVGPWPFDRMGGESNAFQQFVVTISLGYFLLDLSWCLYFQTEGPVMLLHHSLSITGLSVCFVLKMYGIEIVATIMGAELTNPLLQFRWFLRETNQYNSLLGDIVDVLFMVLFGIVRIGLGTLLLISCYMQDTTDWLTRLGGTCIYSIGWVFFISIVQYGIKKYKKKYGSGRKDHHADGTLKANGELSHETNGALGSDSFSVHSNGNGVGTGDVQNGGIHKRHVANGTVH